MLACKPYDVNVKLVVAISSENEIVFGKQMRKEIRNSSRLVCFLSDETMAVITYRKDR